MCTSSLTTEILKSAKPGKHEKSINKAVMEKDKATHRERGVCAVWLLAKWCMLLILWKQFRESEVVLTNILIKYSIK